MLLLDRSDLMTPVATRSKKLTLPEVKGLIHDLLSKSPLEEADLLAFARTVNGADFKVPPAPKTKPKPKGPSLPEIKAEVLAYFNCKTLAELKKNASFKIAIAGEQAAFKTKEDWSRLYRRFIGIPVHERHLEAGPTVINGIDVLQSFRPWVVFGLDPETATSDDVRSAFRRLIKQHHPDQGGDPRVAEQLQKMKDSVLALMS